MTQLFASNLNIIVKRWPIVAAAIKSSPFDHLKAHLVIGSNQTISVNGIQLSSRHDRIAEAKLYINTLPKDVNSVTVYGVGMGDVPTLLIEKNSINTIKVCLLNTSLFSLLITYTDQSEWLSHPKVQLLEPQKQNRLDPVYIAITPDLSLVSNENASLRDLLVYENNIEFVNSKHKLDDPVIKARFSENLSFLKLDPDAAMLKLIHKQHTAFVIGSGPTLEEHYGYLKSQRERPSNDRPLLIAVDTSFKALMGQGIIPDILVSIEHNITQEHLPESIPETVTLVYFPRIPAKVIGSWPGPRFNAYSKGKIYDQLHKTYPKLRLFTNGSVIHPAIDLAVHLNIWEITLFGCDFSYPNNKTHAFWKDGEIGPKAGNAKHWIINGRGERVSTDLNFRAYLRNLEHYIATKPRIKFYQSNLSGAKIKGTQFKDCK
ncbi:DUF115 domain-containing protein [Shewanella sp. SM20]|uniref:motility associated factor glycosyltransferase family protein n=1 Tax=Shewanella sp. SM20 TaxID=2912792 RepID=UPI0021DB4452|nr:6-hydroxymethylpterin diphosphokinase MptE-like protein [Shewanella sp. SM20]MCU8090865.1 DUF115 domain-containing protein [Shewanella sp. SM20]